MYKNVIYHYFYLLFKELELIPMNPFSLPKVVERMGMLGPGAGYAVMLLLNSLGLTFLHLASKLGKDIVLLLGSRHHSSNFFQMIIQINNNDNNI